MQLVARFFVVIAILSATSTVSVQQPKIVHAQLAADAGTQGLNTVPHNLKRQTNPQWIGYSVPVINDFSSGWNESRVVYLEGNTDSNGNSESNNNRTFDHAVILLRISRGNVVDLRIENPDRELDAGGVAFT